jgi:hypothetical protein
MGMVFPVKSSGAVAKTGQTKSVSPHPTDHVERWANQQTCDSPISVRPVWPSLKSFGANIAAIGPNETLVAPLHRHPVGGAGGAGHGAGAHPHVHQAGAFAGYGGEGAEAALLPAPVRGMRLSFTICRLLRSVNTRKTPSKAEAAVAAIISITIRVAFTSYPPWPSLSPAPLNP